MRLLKKGSYAVDRLIGADQHRYASVRVELFAIDCLASICRSCGWGIPCEAELSIMIDSCDLSSIACKIETQSQVRHHGKFGSLDDNVQRELNLKLVLCDVVGNTAKERQDIVKRTVHKSDAFLERKRRIKIESDSVSQLVDKITMNDEQVRQFFNGVGILFSKQEARLRKALDDRDFEIALKGLEAVFARYVQKGIELINAGLR